MSKPNEQKTLLLVEDEVLVALYESQMLQQHGFNVITARSGGEAIEKALAHPEIDLVLMDINLGTGMDGTEAAREILRTRDMPVVFLSSHTEPEVVEKTEQITSYGYVVKDSGEKVLTASIIMAFRLHDAHRKLKESEKRYRMLVETSPMAILIHRFGVVQYANEAAARMFGAPSWKEFIGKNAIEAIHPDDRPRVIERIRRMMENDEPAPLEEERLITLDGNEIFVEVTGSKIEFEGQPASQVFGVNVTDRRRAERELRNRQVEQQSIFDSLPVIIWHMDGESRVRWGNSFAARSIGWSVEDVIGKSVFDLFPAGQAEKFHADNLAVIERGEIKTGLIEEYLTASGERRWAHTDKYPIRDEAGRVTGVILFALDITARVRAEEELRQSEDKYRQLFELESDAIFMIENSTGRILEANAAASALYGYGREDLLALKNTDLSMEPEETRRMTREGGTSVPVRYHRKRDGTGFPVEITARHLSWAGRPVHIAAIRDISARIEVAQTLLELGRRNEEALKAAKMAHWEFDAASGMFSFNDQFYELHGTTAMEAGGYRMPAEEFARRYMHPEFAGQLTEVIARSLSSEEPDFHMQVEGRLLRPDGTTFWVNTWFSAEKDGKGRTVRLRGVNQDITERKSAEEALERWLEEKAALLRELQHRVKNSMAMISSLVSLEASRASAPGTRDALIGIRNRVNSLAHLYEMLYSSGDTRRIRLDQYLNRIIMSLTDSLVDGKHRISFRTRFDEIKIAAQQAAPFGLILNELATNAIKYAYPGDRVGSVRIALEKKEGMIELSVSDDGVGISPSFEEGSPRGLGMQLVKMLSEQLNGTLRVDRGEGTSFYITVPHNG